MWKYFQNVIRSEAGEDKERKAMAIPEIYWEGKSRAKYGYWIHSIGTEFTDAAGNYIYAKQTQPGHWSPVYIGQTTRLRDRLADHEKEACALRNGATHIHTHTTPGGEAERLNEESDLIDIWSPVCNG